MAKKIVIKNRGQRFLLINNIVSNIKDTLIRKLFKCIKGKKYDQQWSLKKSQH